MEIGSSSVQLNVNEVDVNGQKLNRNNKCGARAVTNRIYDPENGTSCHQCRQKRNVFCAACKNPVAGKPCLLKFCHSCLKNRYGEIAQEVDLLSDWMCPKCRGICNCSICMKQRGQQPTGRLARKSKARGFTSVSEMLCKESSEGLELNNAADLPIKEHTSEKELVAGLSGEPDGINALKDEHVKSKKVKREIKEEIPFPTCMELTTILDIEFTQEDVGNVLQFLEFCRIFEKALDIKKEEPGAILRALRSGQNTLVVEFQKKLLNLIDSELESSSKTASDGKNSWLKVLEELTIASDLVLKDFPVDCLKKGNSGYCNLDMSNKLSLLNFICDEALGTPKLRKYMDEQNEIFAEEKKAAKTKVAEAKEKERSLKQKLKDEIAKPVISNEDSLSNSAHPALLAKIKSEAAEAHAELIGAKGTMPKRNQCCETLRIEREYLDNNGKALWKLRSYNDDVFLLQDVNINDEDASEVDEKWFVYAPEQKEEVNKYISSRRV
ncbi:unnamed protein product [Trifolium pratense]|uniref:Uncharacterized protein n=1 Tax=Trifolium pratense TaxID=57577 RepID=A0ACB0KZB3_TRIPR|nr:unnamed protein product [Trifolium pratense]